MTSTAAHACPYRAKGRRLRGGLKTKGGTVNLPTPSEAVYTFKQSNFKSTGIYGIMVQGTDSGANETAEGATKVTDEKVTATVAEGATPSETTTGEGDDAETFTVYTATIGLKKWPLADSDFDGSLADEVTIKGAAKTTVTAVNWKDGKVTLEISYKGAEPDEADDYSVKDETELEATYHYVKAEQTIQVDVDAPTVDEVRASGQNDDGNTQETRPFITIKFNEAEYGGDTHKTVVVTSATLTDGDDNETVLVDDEVNLLSTSDDILFSYQPESALALGEYTVSVIAEDDAGNAIEKAATEKFKVVARPPVSITLNLGWNLISLPAEAADSAIDAVINVDEVSQVLTYDPTVEGGWLAAVRVNGAFEGGLTNIEASKAYLVYTTSVDPLKVDIPGLAQGTAEFPPTVQLYKGWNMVPSSSLDPAFPKRDIDSYLSGVSWSRGYYYDANGRLTGFIPGTGSDATSDDELVIKGRGFLIYVTEDSILVP